MCRCAFALCLYVCELTENSLYQQVVNMFLGLLLPHLDLKNIGLYIMIVFCVCVGVVLILELYICCAKDEESGGYNMGDPSKIGGGSVKLRKTEQSWSIKNFLKGFVMTRISRSLGLFLGLNRVKI